ncbi:MAG: Hsp20/alpha crystallin family protein [Gemmatimonadota bacterium]|nr:Hsp20/alpha crystallin family protein [Gemmatimonadota bacterium]
MTLVKTKPRFPTLRTDFDRFFDRFFPDLPFMEKEIMEAAWMPNLDMTETDKEYLIRLEVPGIPKENLDVSLDGNVLTLSGRREMQRDEENEKFICHEREEGRFLRTVRLPTRAIEDKIDAAVHDGVLTVHLPKAEPSVTNKVKIR